MKRFNYLFFFSILYNMNNFNLDEHLKNNNIFKCCSNCYWLGNDCSVYPAPYVYYYCQIWNCKEDCFKEFLKDSDEINFDPWVGTACNDEHWQPSGELGDNEWELYRIDKYYKL